MKAHCGSRGAGLVMVGLLCCGAPLEAQQVPRPDQRVEARRGVVAAAHPDAARAGLAMLEAGGNAVDAAVATAFALGVVEPMMAGVGGGGSMTVWLADTREALHLEFYGAAGADPDLALDLVPDGSRDTVAVERWVVVPGTVAGLLAALERHGRLPREQVLAPAIRLAREGFVVRPLLARVIGEERAKLLRDPHVAALFYPDGQPLQAGDRLVQPDLAAVLDRIREEGRDGFYRGATAQAIVRTVRARGNPLTLDDLAAFEVNRRRPLCGVYRGYTVLTAPPPLSGVEVLEALELLEPYDLRALGLPVVSGAALGAMVDAMRVAHADRDAWLGDPDGTGVPAVGLAGEAFARERRGLVGADRVPERIAPGDPWEEEVVPLLQTCEALDALRPTTLPRPVPDVPPGPGGREAGGETTHLSVVDERGNAVSLTFTIGDYFGYGVYAAGFFLNDAGENFGGAPANRRGARRTPRSTTAPTIVLEGGRVRLVVGSPGGARIAPAITQVIVYALDYGLDLWAALAAPRAYPTYDAPEVALESGFGGDPLASLRVRGYDVTTRPPLDLFFGGVHAVLVRDDGVMIGAADPRRDGTALGR